ncbi:helix-turn-helix transcriptional regulator [Uliginosibacterium sp. 31-16]|uniref:helix-turn-helix domain-containing protein n=1 Tax=Uliginosibacterium sp. 31-16 TaxID=3068315 RepID=UPI00273D0AD7|nr:helix-turn-helix transcriptional regulator [Uliginosibacterium sp. 31-16]MDP5240819.1 helix-turn-helix transcriptional regulator [Uliginosibacterium sp. 31-16]
MSPVVNRFPAVVRQLREARGWSQEELAERADLNRSYVGEIERGIAMPSLVTINKLACGFELLPSYLLARCEQH